LRFEELVILQRRDHAKLSPKWVKLSCLPAILTRFVGPSRLRWPGEDLAEEQDEQVENVAAKVTSRTWDVNPSRSRPESIRSRSGMDLIRLLSISPKRVRAAPRKSC